MTPLHVDLAMQERLLLNHIDIRLELHRNPDYFCLHRVTGGVEYKVQVHDMSWFVRRVDALKTLALGLEAQLAREAARYPIRRVVIKAIHIDQGRRETNSIPILGGQIPRRIIVGLVTATNYHGALGNNPFIFQHFNVSQMVVTAAGVAFPRNPMTFDFSGKRYTKAYVNLFETLNMSGADRGNVISYNDFADGYCFFCFDLSNDNMNDGGYWDLIKEGTTYLKINFDTDTPHAIKAIVYCEYDNVIKIDKFRNVFFDYSA